MAIRAKIIPKPCIWLSKKEGGALPAQDYYFLGLYSAGKVMGAGYYGGACSQASEEKTITITSKDVSTRFQTINIEWYTREVSATFGLAISPFRTLVQSPGHGFNNEDLVFVRGTNNYDGEYYITDVRESTFEINTPYVKPESGYVFWDAGFPQEILDMGVPDSGSYLGTTFRWDTVSMINPSTSKPYQWLNLNAPRWGSAGGEFDETYGDTRWSCWFYRPAPANKAITSRDFTRIVTVRGSAIEYDKLYDGAGTSVSSRGRAHPDIAFRDDPLYYEISPFFSREKGRFLIFVDDVDTEVDQDDLIDAIEVADDLEDMYILGFPNNNYGSRDFGNLLVMLGSIFVNNNSNDRLCLFEDINIVLFGGQIYARYTSSTIDATNKRIRLERCALIDYGMSGNFWDETSGRHYVDSKHISIGNAMILDRTFAEGLTPQANAMTFYNSCDGWIMIGGFEGSSPTFQFRYPNQDSVYKGTMKNMYIKDLAVSMTYISTVFSITMYMENVEFVNENHSLGYDYTISYSYLDEKDVDMTWDCLDVKSDRPTGQVKINFNNSTSDPDSIIDFWNFRYGINLTIVDENNNPVEGAEISLIGAESSFDATDANGAGEVIMLGYTIEYDEEDSDGYGYKSKTSAWKTADLKICREGYEPLIIKSLSLQEGKDWKEPLKLARINVDQEQL